MKAQNPRILLITPPPIDEYQLEIADLLKGYKVAQRAASNTRKYADSCREVGKALDVPVVDLWMAFMKAAGWEEGQPLTGSKDVERNETLRKLLSDGKCKDAPRRYVSPKLLTRRATGLHFNPAGYQLMFDEVMKVIRGTWPDQAPENLPFILPPWESAPK